MLPSPGRKTNLVLVGGGHAHVQVLNSFARRRWKGVQLKVISDQPHSPYSGMLPGHLAGWYQFDEMHFDLKQMCDKAGAELIVDEAKSVDLLAQDVVLASGDRIDFDVLSFDIGSRPGVSDTKMLSPRLIPLKPIGKFLPRWGEMMQKLWDWGLDRPAEVAVLGGGASGVEVAMVLAARTMGLNRRPHITIWQKGREILPGHNSRVRALVLRALKRWGVVLRTECEVLAITGADMKWRRQDGTQSGHEPCDFALAATPAVGAPLFKEAGLAVDDHGFVKVDKALRVLGQKNIFAAGDCIHFSPRNLPKSGVYAVRQGPVLTYNLKSACSGNKRLKGFFPQRTVLALITLGEQRAVASYGAIALEGKWVWRWKDRIDREFMQRFRL